MTYTRRRFLQGTAAVVAGNMARSAIVTDDPFLMLNRRQMDQPSRNQLFHSLRDDPRVQQLVQTAVDAALSAGATYADARLTFTQDMTVYQSPIPGRHETMGFGVRALVDGYWGFAASPVWNTVEAARLGRAATEQARVNVLGEPREIELAPIANTASGEWIMPVKDDPFEMAYDEIYDFLAGVGAFIRRLPLARTDLVRFDFQRQQKVFGSSSGQLTIQRLYRTGGVVAFSITTSENRTIPLALDCLTPAGAGFEYIREQPLRQLIVAKHEEGMKDLELPLRPIDVGRYPMLLDSYGAAHIVSQTIGRATEVDRAFGYEANAGGTSYITNPLEMLGSYRIGSSLVNISADRHSVGSVGRVKWDDEGVEPTPSQVVKGGVLAHMPIFSRRVNRLHPWDVHTLRMQSMLH
jgi:TldD protein